MSDLYTKRGSKRQVPQATLDHLFPTTDRKPRSGYTFINANCECWREKFSNLFCGKCAPVKLAEALIQPDQNPQEPEPEPLEQINIAFEILADHFTSVIEETRADILRLLDERRAADEEPIIGILTHGTPTEWFYAPDAYNNILDEEMRGSLGTFMPLGDKPVPQCIVLLQQRHNAAHCEIVERTNAMLRARAYPAKSVTLH